MLVAALALITIEGAGCGGSQPVTLPTPATGAERTTTSFGPEQRSTLLDLGLVRQDDLGPGWKETPEAKAGFEVESLEDIAAEPSCTSLLDPLKLLQGSETKVSPVYSSGDRVASNSATLLDSTQSAGTLISVLNGIDPNTCLAKVYQKALEKQFTSIVNDGSTFTSVRVRRRELPGIGDSRAVLEITLDLSKDQVQHSLVFTRVAIQTGPVLQEYHFRSAGAPPDAEEIIKPSVRRVRNCLTKNACGS